MPLPAVSTTKLLDLRVRLYDIALLLLRQAYSVSPPQLVTLSNSVFDPVMPQLPPAELLTVLRLPGTITIVVLHGVHQAILAMNAGTLVIANAQMKGQMRAEVVNKS